MFSLPHLSSWLGMLCIAPSMAHFLLHHPNTIGFDDDNEGLAPCGGFNVSFDNMTNYHVAGDYVYLTSIHPQANWLFRATLDVTAASNWTDLLPVIGQSALGDFCEPSVTVPAPWAGSSGIVQIVQDAPDGILYQVQRLDLRSCASLANVRVMQCAAVSFVQGSATSTPSACQNATGLSASFIQDTVLSTLPATTTMSMPTATSGAPATATAKASAATTLSHETSALPLWMGFVLTATLIALFSL